MPENKETKTSHNSNLSINPEIENKIHKLNLLAVCLYYINNQKIFQPTYFDAFLKSKIHDNFLTDILKILNPPLFGWIDYEPPTSYNPGEGACELIVLSSIFLASTFISFITFYFLMKQYLINLNLILIIGIPLIGGLISGALITAISFATYCIFNKIKNITINYLKKEMDDTLGEIFSQIKKDNPEIGSSIELKELKYLTHAEVPVDPKDPKPTAKNPLNPNPS